MVTMNKREEIERQFRANYSKIKVILKVLSCIMEAAASVVEE